MGQGREYTVKQAVLAAVATLTHGELEGVVIDTPPPAACQAPADFVRLSFIATEMLQADKTDGFVRLPWVSLRCIFLEKVGSTFSKNLTQVHPRVLR